MQRNANTQYPILLVHGLFGFDRIGTFELFHDIKQALRSAGARVFVPHLSATHSNETRASSYWLRSNGFWKGPARRKST